MIAQHVPKRATAVVAAVLVLSGITLTAVHPTLSLPNMKKLNLFQLVGNMNQTTSKMLNNTEALHTQVSKVSQQLSQLQQQESILGQQLSTGKQLEAALSTQITRTQTDVNLMRDIYQKETISAQRTSLIAKRSAALTNSVAANNAELIKLQSALNLSVSESATMNHQMDILLAQLATSKQEFKFFGQVGNLLGSLTGSSGQTGVSGVVGGATSATGSIVNSTSSTLNSTTNTLQSLLP